MDPDGSHGFPKLVAGALVKIDIGREAAGIAADDRQHQLQVLPHDADHAFGRAADPDPDCHRLTQRREDRLIFQGAAGLSRPGDAGVAQEVGEEVKAFLEKLVIVLQLMPEKRVTFGKGPAPEDRLGATVGQGVQRRESLEDPDGIVGGKDGDGGAKLDAPGPAGNGGKHDLGRGDREIGAVMLAQANEINPDFIGKRGLVQNLAQHAVHGLRPTVGTDRDIAERVEAEGNGGHGKLLSRQGRE
jgi:hypothetical protein